MKLPCHLREIRGQRTLRDIVRETGLDIAQISRIEQGISLPKDRDIATLEQAYGARVVDWYPRAVLLAVEGDGDELETLRARMRRSLLEQA